MFIKKMNFRFLLVLATVAVSLSKQDEQEKMFKSSLEIDPQSARILLNNNFESGSADPWYDSSPSTVHWVVEDFTMPSEVNYPPPIPSAGTKYLRATRDAQLSPGFVILRTVEFMALPGDRITFKFWIRSKYTFGNTLELILAIGDTETTLLTLSSYSTSVNLEWRQASTLIPVPEPTVLTLTFYASCGGNAEDAIAIDDIVLEPSDEITTTGLTTVTSTTTVKPKDCAPYFQGNTKVPCWALGNKCYCFTNSNSDNWEQADAFCRTGNMTLLSVETEEEEKLIYSHWQVHPELKSEKYWTSGKFPQKGYNRTYEWATIEPFQRFTYTNWQSGKPGHSDFGYCVYFFMDFDFESGYYWVDYSCNSFYLEYICESV